MFSSHGTVNNLAVAIQNVRVFRARACVVVLAFVSVEQVLTTTAFLGQGEGPMSPPLLQLEKTRISAVRPIHVYLFLLRSIAYFAIRPLCLSCSTPLHCAVVPVSQWLNVVRTPELAITRIVIASVVSLVMGSLFWMTDPDEKGLTGRASYFAFGETKKTRERDKHGEK